MTRKFKVGDRVRVRQWEDMEREFGLTRFGSIANADVFTKSMRTLCGKTATIGGITGEGTITLCNQEDADTLGWGWRYSSDMFEPAEEVKPMSRLAEILGVQEGQEFTIEGIDNTFKIVDGRRIHNADGEWEPMHSETGLTDILNHPEKIKIIPPKPELSESTTAKLRALRVLWPEYEWIARDADGWLKLFNREPELKRGCFFPKNEGDPIYIKKLCLLNGEITHDMGAIYYGDL